MKIIQKIIEKFCTPIKTNQWKNNDGKNEQLLENSKFVKKNLIEEIRNFFKYELSRKITNYLVKHMNSLDKFLEKII